MCLSSTGDVPLQSTLFGCCSALPERWYLGSGEIISGLYMAKMNLKLGSSSIKNLIFSKPLFLLRFFFYFMKELDIIVPHERLNEINGVLYKHKVGGMYFHDVSGRGRAKREDVEIVVATRRTGKFYVPEFGSRTIVSVIVSDSMEKPLIDELINVLTTGEASDGKIFVKDVTGAYDIGSKEFGDNAAAM